MNIGELRATLGADLTQLQRSMKQAEQTIKNYDKTVGRELNQAEARYRRYGARVKAITASVKNSLFSLRAAFVGIGGALVARAFVRFGASYERTMSIVKVVSKATGKEMDAFRKQTKQLGESTEFTAKQAGDALRFLAMAGLSVQQSMAALPKTLDLATSGQIDLARAADISTNIMSQMGLKAEELSQVNDALVAVMSSANTNIEEAAQAFVFAGAKAAEFGVDVFELNALIGILANNGIKATMAGTTLRQSMIKLLDPTTKAKKILDAYGIKLRDSEGRIRSYIDILKDLADAGLDVVEMNKLFGARAANISVVLKQGSAGIQDVVDSYREMEGVSKSAAETIRKDVQGALDELVSIMQGVVLDVWDEYKDKVRSSITTITRVIRENKEGIVGAFNVVVGSVETLIGVFLVLKEGIKGALFPFKAFIEATKEFEQHTKTFETLAGLKGGGTDLPGVLGLGGPFQEKALKKSADGQIKIIKSVVEEQNKSIAALKRVGPDIPIRPENLEKSLLIQKEIGQEVEKQRGRLQKLFFPEEQGMVPNRMEEVSKTILATTQQFNAEFDALGKSRFALERERIDKQGDLYKKAGIDRIKVEKWVAAKQAEIDKAQFQARLESIRSVAGMMSDNFKKIAEMGGKFSKEAFVAYKAFKIVETVIATQSAAMKAYEAMVGIPFIGPALAAAAAAATVAFGVGQVAAIAASQPPSFARGGRPPVGRASIVGEKGPELFMADRPGRIIPNDALSGLGMTIQYFIDARGAELGAEERILRALQETENRAVSRAKLEVLDAKRRGGAFASGFGR